MSVNTKSSNILPRILSRFDLIALYFALIFGSYGAAQLATFGWVSLPMLLLATVTFLLPCVLAAYELGTLYPGEGGIYVWAQKTAGPVHGFIAGWLSWVPIFFLLPLGSSVVIAHIQIYSPEKFSTIDQISFQTFYLAVVFIISALNLRLSQNYIKLMFFISLFTAITVFTTGIYKNDNPNPIGSEIFSLNLAQHGAVYSAAVLWLLGVEVPFNMGDEFKVGKRDVGLMFIWGTLSLVTAYAIGIVGILLIQSATGIDATIGVASSVASVSPIAGLIVAICIVFAISSQDVAYMTSYSRLVLISGLEKKLPSIFSYVTAKNKVPVPAMLLQFLGSVFVACLFSGQQSLSIAFNYYIATLVIVWCGALFYIYYGLVISRLKFSDEYLKRGDNVWKIPGGKLSVIFVSVWGAAFNCLAIYYVFSIPMTSGVETSEWRITLSYLTGIVILIGIATYGISSFLNRSALIKN